MSEFDIKAFNAKEAALRQLKHAKWDLSKALETGAPLDELTLLFKAVSDLMTELFPSK